MTTTDDTALQEQIARAIHAESTRQLVANMGAPGESWDEAPKNRRERFRDQAAAVLPIIRPEVAKARAEALRDAADRFALLGGQLAQSLRLCADQIEKEQNDG